MATYLDGPNFSSLATDPIRNFKFLVTINHNVPHVGNDGDMTTLGFTSLSGLSVTTESIPYRQGGYNTTVHQIPGQTSFTPITLQRGMLLGTGQSWQWMKQLFFVIAGSGNGGASENFRCNVDISVLAHPDTITPRNSSGVATGSTRIAVQKFRVYNAWITSLSYSDLNAGDNNFVVEQMTLAHEGFDMTVAAPPTVSGQSAAGNFIV